MQLNHLYMRSRQQSWKNNLPTPLSITTQIKFKNVCYLNHLYMRGRQQAWKNNPPTPLSITKLIEFKNVCYLNHLYMRGGLWDWKTVFGIPRGGDRRAP